MKNADTLRRSARARLNAVIRKSNRLGELALDMRDGFSPEAMAEMRALAGELAQCVHEFNAYHNALETD